MVLFMLFNFVVTLEIALVGCSTTGGKHMMRLINTYNNNNKNNNNKTHSEKEAELMTVCLCIDYEFMNNKTIMTPPMMIIMMMGRMRVLMIIIMCMSMGRATINNAITIKRH